MAAAVSEDAPFSFDSGHSDLIHDVQVDYYGKTIASASSDCYIRIFEVIKDGSRFICKLPGHTGPVWKLSWAPPPFTNVLASCGYDKRLIVWRQTNKQWIQWFVDEFTSSVNAVQFAPITPNNNTLELIAGCSDGNIKVYALQSNKKWTQTNLIERAHSGGVNAISWATPSNIVVSSDDSKQNDANNNMKVRKRFVSGGCDNLVKIWSFEYNKNDFEENTSLKHDNWVRDVAWSPLPTSSSHSIVASCSEDKTVVIWKENNGKWAASEILKFEHKVWSVSWSELGNILAVALGENTVQLFKEGNDGKWQNVSKVH